MSLSQLSLPSISRVLEGEVDPNENNATVQEDADASIATSASTLAPALVPQCHLMKTMDLRGNDLENEEEELFSFVVGFPDEAEPDKDDAQTIFEERKEVNVPEPKEEEEEPQAPVRWLEINLAQWVMAIRRLFPVRFAEIFLRKAGQELAQR